MTVYEHVLYAMGLGRRLTAHNQQRRPPKYRFICSDTRGLDQVLLHRYRLGDLSEHDRANVETHLRACAGCRRYLEMMDSRWEHLSRYLKELHDHLVASRDAHTPDAS